MSNLLADFEPALRAHVFDAELNPHLVADPYFFFSFRCPTCNQHRIEIPVKRRAHEKGNHWALAGELPEVSIHPSIWSHTHSWWNEEKQAFERVDCEWHRCIFKGRFIDELFAWPVDDPANAKFG